MIIDLISMHQQQTAPVVWTPAQLFQNGERGYWLDSSDYSTLFQNAAGTVPVTAAGQSVGLWKNKIGQAAFNFSASGPGTSSPTTALSSGKPCINYNGASQLLNTPDSGNIANSGITICMGQRKSATSAGERAYYGVTGSTVSIQNQPAGNIFGQAFGQTLSSVGITSTTVANVITMLARVAATPLTIRLNGTANMAASNPSSGTVGSSIRIVGDASNDCDISQVVFINRVLTPSEITQLEAFVAGKQ